MCEQYVIDGTIDTDEGVYCFCPIENGHVVTGISILASEPPGKVVGVIHFDGEQAAEAFYQAHKAVIDNMVEETR